jgi:hypothetical protein
MADSIDGSREVQALHQKVDELSASVDRRFERMEQRFDGDEAALGEQRASAEFAYVQLDKKMDAGFARLERKLDQIIDLHLPKTPPGSAASPR